MNRIVCAISGGVDSAVAALLLKRKGFSVTGVFMKNWDLTDESGYCGTEEDREYAREVCKVLEIPFHEVNFVKEYWNNVFQHTMDEYQAGRTPNPDVLCNRYIKFDSLFSYVKKKMSIDLIATGHYARTQKNFSINFLDQKPIPRDELCSFHQDREPGHLYKATDENKDQTFFLHRIHSQALRRTIFPIGGLYKSEVKSIAEDNGLKVVANRKESMGICFIGLRNFQNFILDYIPPKKGNFICLETGKVLGVHNGYFKYTLGQRARLGGLDVTHCVAHKDAKSGHVYVAPGSKHPALFSKAVITTRPYWINGAPEAHKSGRLECGFRFMHRDPIITCTIFPYKEYCLIILSQPLRSLTPGQSAVFYTKSCCLGGSDILHIGPSIYELDEGEMALLPFRTDAELWRNIFQHHGSTILPSNHVQELESFSFHSPDISPLFNLRK